MPCVNNIDFLLIPPGTKLIDPALITIDSHWTLSGIEGMIIIDAPNIEYLSITLMIRLFLQVSGGVACSQEG